MKKAITLSIVFLSLAFPLASFSKGNTSPPTNAATAASSNKPLYWIDPMEPNKHYTAPGQSAMGMTLQPVYPKQGNSSMTPPKSN